MENVVQVVGYKKTGKTTLVCRLIEHFSTVGLKVASIKHDAHEFEPDVPGTDSWKHRHAGAKWSAVASPGRTAYYEERGAELEELLLRMKDADLIIVEGWKRKPYPKIAMIQSADQLPLLDELDSIIAVVTWADTGEGSWAARVEAEYGVPVVSYDDLGLLLDVLDGRVLR